MDKTEQLWYNSDMNDIIYAGEKGISSPIKYTTVFVAKDDGHLKWTDGELNFNCGQIVVIPPLVKCFPPEDTDLRVYMDKALISFKKPIALSDDSSKGLTFALLQAKEYFQKGCTGILSGLGELIAGYISAFAGVNEFSPVVRSLKSEIENNLSNPLFLLDDCIRRLPLNYDYVRKLFKKEVGVTPHEYLVSARMELAKSLISSGMSNQYSNYTVSQLAEACGFFEPLYFSRVFKAHFGMSPKEFKEREKK
jgi:AraC-like DNA-binding protein